MYSLSLVIGAFNGEADWDLSNQILAETFEYWARVAELWLRADPSIPLLYESKVRYYADPLWEGPWLDVKTALAKGFADCKSLAAWRIAELRVRYGIRARARFDRRLIRDALTPDGRDVIHVYVEYEDGRVEDPSRLRGM